MRYSKRKEKDIVKRYNKTYSEPQKRGTKGRAQKKMEMEKVIARINELYHKSQAEGLNEEEKLEQAKLRGIYLAAIRKNLRGQLDNISVMNPDGSIVDLADVAAKNRRKGN